MASTARVAAALFLLLLGLSATAPLAARDLMSAAPSAKKQPAGRKPSVQPGYPGTNPGGGGGGGIPTIPGFGSIPGMGGGMGGFNVPGMGGGWGGGYGTPSGGYSRGGVVVPTVVCSDKGPCYRKKVTCPKKCFSSYSSSGKGYGGGGGGGGCTIDCKTKCTAYC
ncbi:MFS18 protein [Oryza sativa Japonica Group]|uniref:Expressed protein n=7 Tax=Oryza TaxID=4527 RepID=Q9FRF5_ORYSJ|nr:ATP-dependent RNA helicase A [Oryza sativa Japonica Group]XP_052146878.1 uncharacterized protein LOC127765939 [Oryza glaberrima]EAY91372.1 hypothetical protein OsI_12992 [Oryza sativa Indica Group]KAB8092990.1 hypothetical protein EE612_019625 [Oryza sativa]AAG46079.1 expressed protein [Oryza sativa Japonica Group]ABF98166.1 expressed protein [Oryza sativa Japonica Group]EAY91373.1 hypothetical protein OsI_12993 [Oryza sativa Indica Group]|eukprot:NP_001050889.1 Os03g0676300 [Oryza sativa Japonica Group]